MITPVLSYSEVALAENVRRLNQVVVDTDACWAAALTDVVSMCLLRDVVLPTTKMASCWTVGDAAYLAEAGFDQIILIGRVVDTDALRRLQCIAERTQILAVIDHFRHAELMSQSAQQSGREIQVLVEVDVGWQSTGVRPGPDASLLATAASRLPGLKVIGVFASATDCRTEREPGDSDKDLASIVTIADHALRSICDVAGECREMVVSVTSVSRRSLPDTRINCLIVSPFIDFDDDSHDSVRQSCVCLIATVVSRPTLECCVIDAGRIAFGDASAPRVEAPSGASILHSTPETSTLQLSGEASDLRIGDTVRLVMRNPERLLNRVRLS